MKYESCDARSGCTFEHIMHVLTGLGYRDAAYQQLYRQLFKNGGIVDRDITYPDARNVVEAIVHDGGGECRCSLTLLAQVSTKSSLISWKPDSWASRSTTPSTTSRTTNGSTPSLHVTIS